MVVSESTREYLLDLLQRTSLDCYIHFQKYLRIPSDYSYKMATYRKRKNVIINKNWYICPG